MRWSPALSAASSGSALPVTCACCSARRTADSMSTTRFSSRERDRLCISSSSCERCSATSATRVSVSASRAAVSRTASCAWRASVRASMDCASASALWRASCSCMPLTFCQSASAITSATTATSGEQPEHDARQQQMPPRAMAACERGRQGARAAGSCRVSFGHGGIAHAKDSIDATNAASAGLRDSHRAETGLARGLAMRGMGGDRARRRPARAGQRAAQIGDRLRTAEEPDGARRCAPSAATVPLGGARRTEPAAGRRPRCRTAPPAAAISRASQSRPAACPDASPPRTISTRAPGAHLRLHPRPQGFGVELLGIGGRRIDRRGRHAGLAAARRAVPGPVAQQRCCAEHGSWSALQPREEMLGRRGADEHQRA